MSERRDSVAEERMPVPMSARGAGGSVGHGDARRSSPHAQKFVAVTAALVALAVAAVAVALVVAFTTQRSSSGPAWSSWTPPDGGLAGEREIAAAVSPFYEAAPSVQLAVVTVRNITTSSSSTSNNPGTQIAVRDPNNGQLSPLGGTTALYALCGLGAGCALGGTPSIARELLLRREALELALYTFRYISGIDTVVAVLPPGHATVTAKLTPTPTNTSSPPTTVDIAVVFQRTGLQRELNAPLRETLPETLPPTVAEMPSAPEAALVRVITGQTLFTQRTVQAQDGSNVLVLDPLPPQ